MTRYLPTRRVPDDRLLLLCFPYAGGGASAYASWQRRLGDRVEVLPVQLPGREGRGAEPRFTELAPLIAELHEELGPELERPHVLFGHSMGALLAFSLAQHRYLLGERLPEALVVSAFRAPHLPAPKLGGSDVGDEELIDTLVGLGGIPRILLDHPEWLSALLPVARDDLRLCAAPVAGDPLPVPLHAYAGQHDALVTPTEVAEWVQYAGCGFTMRTLPGGHFYLRDDEQFFLDDLGRAVDDLALLAR
ncbi:thioesterase II family protein [Streptacidiphilus jiangxiensis]|uniref:Surfactin synthase thioesterase subunit n=1 Tax=Streptacidiphilus jiangxiensis TaxID=235985 RepID=A0A1H7IA48_STRJI|nr:alpha/beta fold hydrolase [Streptacidiphilus jiangxiensis]SEK59369.1 Surfactin synthase thioesterase subunit [Streptacidiphilus jiangxiensis]